MTSGSSWPTMPPTSFRPQTVPVFVQASSQPDWRPTTPPML